jgi:anti-sigma factor RsiW
MTNVLHAMRFRRDHRWVADHMSAYVDGDLAARPRARMQRHTEECPDCRGVLGSLRRMLGMLASVPSAGWRASAPDITGQVLLRLRQPDAR